MLCEEQFKNLSVEDSVDDRYNKVVNGIYFAASQSIPLSSGISTRKNVPWGSEECSAAIRERNKAFQFLKRTLTPEAVIDYQRKRAYVKKIIKSTKRTAWQNVSDTIGRETEVNAVWRMIKKMNGIDSFKKIPVMEENGKVAITDKEKVIMSAQTFAKAH